MASTLLVRTYAAQLIHVNLMTLTILREDYKLSRSSCNFLRPPVTFF